MLLKAYYQLKPIIPRRAQLTVRRFVMRRRRLKCADVWSIIPVPIYLQEAYHALGLPPGSFPFTESSAGEIVSLPMYAELQDEQVAFVCEQIKTFLRK